MASGFGKVILLGEHAVVYGHPALAGALSLAVEVTVKPAAATTLSVPPWNLDLRVGPETASSRLARAIASLVEADGHPPDSFEIIADSTLPSRAGLGSSAALSVAITRALAEHRGETLTLADVERRANLGETCFHDNPSGVDVALAARGGLGLFRIGAGFESVRCRPFKLVIGQTGEQRQTGDMVTAVARARESFPKSCNRALARLGELATDGVQTLASTDTTDSNDVAKLGEMFNEAQTLLAGLGVSSAGIETMVTAARDNGALGCKLTGAGGGGSVIAFAPGSEDAVAAAWKQRGFSSIVATIGSEKAPAKGAER